MLKSSVLNKMSSSSSGQAMIEILPSLMIFFVIMSAGLVYFRVMRAATIRQEVVRNLAMAKINNMGSLTTPPNQMDGSNPGPLSLSTEIRPQRGGGVASLPVINKNNNEFLSYRTQCFTVVPDDARAQIPLGNLLLIGALAPVELSTLAVVYRDPGGSCP